MGFILLLLRGRRGAVQCRPRPLLLRCASRTVCGLVAPLAACLSWPRPYGSYPCISTKLPGRSDHLQSALECPSLSTTPSLHAQLTDSRPASSSTLSRIQLTATPAQSSKTGFWQPGGTPYPSDCPRERPPSRGSTNQEDDEQERRTQTSESGQWGHQQDAAATTSTTSTTITTTATTATTETTIHLPHTRAHNLLLLLLLARGTAMMAATTDPNMAPAPAANESDSDPDAVVPPEEAPPPPLLSATGLHSHRLNHTASKLSSFRLADRDGKLLHNSNQPQHSGSLVAHQPQQHPSPPVSPHTGPAGPAGTHSTPLPVGTAPHHSAQNPSAFPENSISAPAPLRRHLLPPSTLSPVTETNDPNPASSQQHQNHTDTSDDSPHSIISPFQESPRSRTSSNRTVSTSAPVTPLTTFNKRSASLNSDNAPIPSTPPDPARSQTDADSPSFWTPASRPRTRRASLSSRASSLGRSPIPLARTRSKESSQTTAQQQQQQQQDHTTSQTANHSSPPDESRTLPRRRSSTSSRPPLSYRSVSGRPIIPPIRSFRSSGSRRSSQIDMNGQSSHYYDDGDEYHDPHARDRSLRALEGRINNDWQRDADADDDNVTESENNTADIFMNIAREDSFPSGSRRRTDGRGEDDQNSVIVSLFFFLPCLIRFPRPSVCA